MDNERISVPEAARLLEIGQDEVRAWLRSKNGAPWGVYVRQDGKKQGRYIIYRSRILAYINAEDMKAP